MNMNNLQWKSNVFEDEIYQLFINLNEKVGEEGRLALERQPWELRERRPMYNGWCVNILDRDILYCGVKGYVYMNPKIYGVDYISVGKVVLVHDILTKYSVRNIYEHDSRGFFDCDGSDEDRDVMAAIIHSLTGFFKDNDYSYATAYFREDDEIVNKMALCYANQIGSFWPRSCTGKTILMVDNCLYKIRCYVYLVGCVSREDLILGVIDRGEYAAYRVTLKISDLGFEVTVDAAQEGYKYPHGVEGGSGYYYELLAMYIQEYLDMELCEMDGDIGEYDSSRDILYSSKMLAEFQRWFNYRKNEDKL
ncbi:Hypothetical predicted protein [Paramuricea clavata]|uniref:Uncharacterized protein n=1 Tax=Paramuricea clavata TaxID=317549 RepID=A0A6S7FNW4_PARCT|nr:Hypothetical predicted protein [Paramuricea clavata]